MLKDALVIQTEVEFAFDQLAPLALLKLAVILHENYGSFDLAALALEAHDCQTGSSLQPAYMTRLVTPTA
jgi:hypothetical protein